ncbi:putative ubiquitin-protein ligase [Tanacetum coccineum]
MSESSRIYRGKEIMTDMNARFKIDISYSQAWRAKCYALQLLRGTPEESFAELPLYCHNLKLKNQGTITHIETDDEDRFEIFFSCHRCCDEHKHELTPWAEAKLAQRIAKSTTWTVRPAANYLYNVVDYYKNATVDLNTRTCSCGQWQLSGLPCGHLIAVMRHLRQSSANQFAFSCFKTSVWRASYNEVIYDVGHPSEWDKPDGLITVLPPVMDKRQPGRPRNRDRFRSKGEQITQKSCTRCFKGGHNRRDCPSVVPSQIFIPTTSSVKSGSSWNVEI